MDNFLIVGTGSAALRLADALTDGLKINRKNVKLFSRRPHQKLIKGYVVIDSIFPLRSFDAVFVATEAFDHLRWIKACIAESTHCYIEKPLICTEQFSCEAQLVDQVENGDTCVFNGCQYLSHPAIDDIKRFLGSQNNKRSIPTIFKMHLGHDIRSWGCWKEGTTLQNLEFLMTEDGLFDELIHVYEILAHLFGLEGKIVEIGSDNLMLSKNSTVGAINFKFGHVFGSILIELISKDPTFQIHLSSSDDQLDINLRDDSTLKRDDLFVKHVRKFLQLINSDNNERIHDNNIHIFDGLRLRSNRESYFL